MESGCSGKVSCDEEIRRCLAGQFLLLGSREAQWGLTIEAQKSPVLQKVFYQSSHSRGVHCSIPHRVKNAP